VNDLLRIAMAQLVSVDNVELNFNQIKEILNQVKSDIPRFVFFPENCLYFRIKEGEAIPTFELSDVIFQELSNLAQNLRMNLHLGSVPLKINNQVFNSSVMIWSDGKIEATYQKNHLFDIQLTNQNSIKESDVFSHGTQAQIIHSDDWKFGQSICYDIRFSELYSYYAHNEVDAILIPSAFLVKTGQAHWDILNKARAIENQCYVISSAQGGTHSSSIHPKLQRETYGHSLIIDPWGNEIICLKSGLNSYVTELSKKSIQTVRSQIPMKSHRKTHF
jgi:predicted amidohydrolase